jgi:2-polyprenyl-3-methyl-5-hydroxy-6-metoxy-1,4-benzoquinol methylase
MNISSVLKALKRTWSNRFRLPGVAAPEAREYSGAAERIRVTGRFELPDIDLLASTIERYDLLHGTPWDDFRQAHCVLPDWYRRDLNPFSQAYAAQQERLWSALAGVNRSYQAELDEQDAPLAGVDAIRRPGYFIRRDSESVAAASDHVLATGMILKYSELRPGDSALEYGAGFGPIALTLARLGVLVDTVDISSAFCGYVREQAQFFQVPLTPFQGRFGWNPREGHRYDLIFFFQAFHHCVDFLSVVHDLKRHLAPKGRILLSSEPIAPAEDAFIPYPWGLKLHAESVAQIRRYHWFELGFTEEFLTGVFINAGFSAERFEAPASSACDTYRFEHRPERIDLWECWLPSALESGWNSRETQGRWTRGEARLFVDASASFQKLIVVATNHHPFALSVEIEYGPLRLSERFRAGERKELVLGANSGRQIVFRSPAYSPARDYLRKRADNRTLGLFVQSLRYR